MAERGSELDQLVSEAAIRRVLARYCRGVDRLDRELVRSCYHEGATDSHGNFDGIVDEFIAWAFGLLERYTVTMHFLGTILIEFSDDPDVAFSEAYGIAYHRGDPDKPHRNLTTAFRYVDRFERRPVEAGESQWRIAQRYAVSEWVRTDPPEGWWPVPDDHLAGRRDADDVVYRIRDTE